MIETKGMKIVKELPNNRVGHIVVFEDPIVVEQLSTTNNWTPTGKVAKCYFMRVEGGFGAHSCCSGRMLIGNFFETIQDVIDNKVFSGGNTKCYPTGYITELFVQYAEV